MAQYKDYEYTHTAADHTENYIWNPIIQISTLLKEQGFKVTHFIGCGRLPYLWKSMVIRATI